MTVLAKLAMRGVPFAAALAAFLLLASVLPVLALGAFGAFVSFLVLVASSAIIALGILRKGTTPGLYTLAMATLAATVLGLMIGAGFRQGVLMALMFWLPTAIGAVVLRETVSLDRALIALALFFMVGVAIFYLVVADPLAMWKGMLSEWASRVEALIEASASVGGGDSVGDGVLLPGTAVPVGTDLSAFVDVMARMMTGAIAATLLWISIVSLLLARSWQAKLYNPGGFQPEFHRLRSGKMVAGIGAGVCVAAVGLGIPVLTSMATVIIAAFLFQGLAVVHALVRIRGMSQGWLVGVYAMLVLLQTSILLGALGMADNWLNLRKL